MHVVVFARYVCLLFFVLVLLPGLDLHAHENHRADTLSAAIDDLRSAVADSPTNIENVDERLETFWLWANDYALTGLPIDPDVPATVARIRDPGPKDAISPLDLADIDHWVREFSYREDNPSAVGTLSSPKLSGLEVDKYHALTLKYTVGSRTLSGGDGFVLGELTYGRGPLLQARDPKGDNYVSIKTDAGVEFEVDGYPIRGMFSGTMARSVVMTGPAQKVFFKLKRGSLAPGSVVTITLGDQTMGSRGVGLIAPSVDALRFRVWLHFESEKLLVSLPELQFESVGGPVAGVRGFGPSIVGIGESFEITVRFEDQFRNLATGEMPEANVMLNDEVVKHIPAGTSGIIKIPDITLDATGVYRYTISSPALSASGELNPILVKETPEQRLYWGETHGHSGFSEGMGSVDGVYQFARDDARLDFMALTEHDYWMDDAEWETLRNAAIKYNETGKFLAFLAYEWTVHAKNGGHHNIIFRTPNERQRVSRQDVQSLGELYKQLAKAVAAEDLLLIPHAHNPGDWAINDSATEKFVEIVSLHGTFEWFGQRYLDEGFMVGFLGGSDDHMGHPGLRPLRRNPTSDNFGGLLGLYASAKTNDAVFDAMRNIQGYATNGVRSILELKLNGSDMGRFIEPADSAAFAGQVYGTAPIEKIILMKNGEAVYSEDFAATENSDSQYVEIRFWSDSYPRKKGGLARQWRRWRGSIGVSGATMVGADSPQNDNEFTEFLKPRGEGQNVADFFLKTRGSYKSMILEIGERKVDAHLILRGIKESPLPGESMQALDFEIPLGNLSQQPIRLDVETEGYDDHILIRSVKRLAQLDVELNFTHNQPAHPGDYYYLRIRQMDGGLVWSSPMRVGEETMVKSKF